METVTKYFSVIRSVIFTVEMGGQVQPSLLVLENLQAC